MSERAPLQAVPGLARTEGIPKPPKRRPPRVELQAGGGEGPEKQTETSASLARGKQTPSRPISATASTLRPISLSLPISLVSQVKARARADELTQAEVILDALSATRERLPDLLAKPHESPVSDGLFLRKPRRRDDGDPLVTLTLRVMSPNLAVIDELVTSVEAPSRSALCAAALRAYFFTSER